MKRIQTILLFIFLLSYSSAQPKTDYYLFKWKWEPNEKAFKILLPQNWETEGGIFRIDPTAGGGAANALEAKLDFSMKCDKAGTAMMRWYPDMFYFDSRYSPAGQLGLFPAGSNYQGMTVIPLVPPDQFILKIVLPYAHPGISNISVVENKNLPELANAVQNEDKLMAGMGFTYNAALVTVNYTNDGKVFEEKIVSVIMNLGQAGAGMWKNRYTFSVRAPRGKLKEFEPVFSAIGNSLTLNRQWLAGEIKGQLERAGIYNKTMAEINRISEEINQHRQQNNAVIQNDMYLNLTGQEEYINPFTNEIETGTNEWNHRWSGNNDFVIYTDDPNFDPNRVPELNHFEFKRSPIKKR
ncbi:MAG: hypothetical protein V2I31_01240 [Mariniphaga sp.]|jgi:hypothetical protein|nr:hypothetical protein [Mariniphaga sp.]